MTATSPAALPALALDLVYGERDAAPCAVCRTVLPAVTAPLYELETEQGEPLCRPSALRVRPALASAVAFLTRLARALADDPAQGREALEAVLSGVELFYEANSIPIPSVQAEAPRKPRTAPHRGRRSKGGKR
jgi:hypothetical protein